MIINTSRRLPSRWSRLGGALNRESFFHADAPHVKQFARPQPQRRARVAVTCVKPKPSPWYLGAPSRYEKSRAPGRYVNISDTASERWDPSNSYRVRIIVSRLASLHGRFGTSLSGSRSDPRTRRRMRPSRVAHGPVLLDGAPPQCVPRVRMSRRVVCVWRV